MSQNQNTRSTLTIDAVAQTAAAGGALALNPLKKFDVIAGLAGFVLRLFRSREQLPPMVGWSPGETVTIEATAKDRPGHARAKIVTWTNA